MPDGIHWTHFTCPFGEEITFLKGEGSLGTGQTQKWTNQMSSLSLEPVENSQKVPVLVRLTTLQLTATVYKPASSFLFVSQLDPDWSGQIGSFSRWM